MAENKLIDPFDSSVENVPAASAPVDNGGLVDPFDKPALPIPMRSIQEPQQEGFGARLQREIESIPRQAGLAGRYMVEGPAEFLSIFTNPLTYGLEKITGKEVPTTSEMGQQFADYMGLPSPETQQERVVGAASKLMVPVGGQAKLAEKGASAMQAGARKGAGMVERIMEKLSMAPTSQLTGAAAGGAAGQYTAETGGGPAEQFVAALGGGLVGSLSPAVAQRLIGAGISLVNSMRGSATNLNQINERLSQILASEGIDITDIPQNVRNGMAVELKHAIETGGTIDEAAMRRIADYAVVGAKPTRGSVTLDPVQITQEKNMAKYGANSTDPNLQALARRQYENDRILTSNLNEMGAGQASDKVSAGREMMEALRTKDAPRKTAVDHAYQSVRDDAGRYANLNVPQFSTLANSALDEQMLGSALPAQARSLLNDISIGKIPLNVNTMVQLDKRLSGIRRTALASGDNEAALSVQTVRQALWNTEPDGSAGQKAIEAYHNARQMAAHRFKLIEENPAMQAALDDADPDKFVEKFIIGSGKDASVRKTANLAGELKNPIDVPEGNTLPITKETADEIKKVPEAFQAAREQILYYLKNKALSGADDEVGNFSPSAFRRAMDSIGEKKLELFFTKGEINRLNAIRRVAGYEKHQPTGSAVNNSNTASAALTTLMEKIGENAVVAKFPIIRVLGSFAADQSRAQAAKVAAERALRPGFTSPAKQAPAAAPAALAIPAATQLSEK